MTGDGQAFVMTTEPMTMEQMRTQQESIENAAEQAPEDVL